MLSKIKAFHEECEDGFTLIELLVVILIIGILAAIAIPVFLNQRQTANDAAVKSDARNAIAQVETWVATKAGADITIDATELAKMQIKESSSVVVQVRGTSNNYCVFSSHPNSKKYPGSGGYYYTHDSAKGTHGDTLSHCGVVHGSIGADGNTITTHNVV